MKSFDDELLMQMLEEGERLQTIVDENYEAKYFESVNEVIDRERDIERLEERVNDLGAALADSADTTAELYRALDEMRNEANGHDTLGYIFVGGIGITTGILLTVVVMAA